MALITDPEAPAPQAEAPLLSGGRRPRVALWYPRPGRAALLQGVLAGLAENECDAAVWTEPEMQERIQQLAGPDVAQAAFWSLRNPREDMPQFLHRAASEQSRFDPDVLLWDENLEHLPTTGLLRWECPSVLMLHSVRSWAVPNVVPTRRRLRETFAKYRLLRRSVRLLVPSEDQLAWAALNLPVRRPMRDFLPVLHSPREARAQSGRLRIVVPGAIQPGRRDYSELLEAVRSLPDDTLRLIDLRFVGGNPPESDESLLHPFEALEERGLWVRTWMRPLPQKEFEDELAAAHILLSPLQQKSRSTIGIHEHNGVTRISGVLSDSIRFGRPVLRPHWHPVHDDFRNCSLAWSDTESLSKVLSSLSHDRAGVDNLIRAAKEAAAPYTVERAASLIRARLLSAARLR